MKKILYTFFFVLFSVVISYAQSVSTDPVQFTGDDEVTIIVNTTGTSLAGYGGDVYVWTWVTNEAGVYKGPDAPTNSNPAGAAQAAAKMTRSETDANIYTITFVPSEFYGTPAINIEGIGILAKGADWGNGQTPDFKIDVQPPVFDSPVIRIFPSSFSADDVVSIFYDTTLEENEDLLAEGEFYLNITINGTDINGDPLNSSNYYLPIDATTKLKAAGNGLYRITFVPNKFFTLNAGDVITALRYKIQNDDGQLTNPPTGFDLLSADVLKRAN